MSTPRIAALTWILIFGGLLGLGLGVTILRTEHVLGSLLIAACVAAILAGAVLIWVRSRMPMRDDMPKDSTAERAERR